MSNLKVEDISYVYGHRPFWVIQNNKGNAGADLTDEEIDEFAEEFKELFFGRAELLSGKKYPFNSWNRDYIEKIKKRK